MDISTKTSDFVTIAILCLYYNIRGEKVKRLYKDKQETGTSKSYGKDNK